MGFERLLLPLLCLGVAHAQPDPRDVKLHQQKAQLLTLERQATAMKTRNETLEARLDIVEQGLGYRAFRPKIVKKGRDDWFISPDRAMRVSDYEARPIKTNLKKEVAGETYVIAFWATWCKPCTSPEEVKALHALQKELRLLGKDLYGVAVDGMKKVRGHKKAPDWYYPIYQRTDAHIDWMPESFMKAVGLGLPLFVVVSGTGELLFWHNSTLNPYVHQEIVTAAARGRW